MVVWVCLSRRKDQIAMRKVSIVSAAMIKMGKYPNSSYSGLAAPPLYEAITAAGLDREDIDAVYCGHAFGGMLTGQRISRELGLGGVPVTNVDNACSGGATALALAVESIRSGKHDLVAVIGVDKLTQFGGGMIPLVAEDWEVQQGMVMPAMYAMRARRFLHERGATPADLAGISVKNRRHGALNPFAQFQKEITVEQVLSSRMIAEPLTLLQCCPTGDGAAVVIVSASDHSKVKEQPQVRITASVLHSGQVKTGFRDMLKPEISADSARDAYEEAGISPDDLDVVELHDAFTIAELVYYEALGLCQEGDALEYLSSGATTFGGNTVVNPSGGLLAKGHPVGASGVAQAVEIYWQLTGQAGKRQVENARRALSHVTGGGIAGLDHGSCSIHLYETA
jgi:acetyl-CoA acetyltransferase